MIAVADDSRLLLLARHGATQDNADGLILGHHDPPLSEAGREQAETLGRRALEAGVGAIWSSPLLRARQTAALVGAMLGIEPRVQEQLIESYRGSWEGRPVREIAAESPELHAGFEAAVRATTTTAAARARPNAGQVLISPCGLSTNFLATPLSKSL